MISVKVELGFGNMSSENRDFEKRYDRLERVSLLFSMRLRIKFIEIFNIDILVFQSIPSIANISGIL